MTGRAPRFFGRASFTLIELLVVIAVIAILAIGVILVLNPAELLKQSRDSNRIADMASISSALSTFVVDQNTAFMGTSTVVYVSLPDASSTCGDLSLPALSNPYSYSCASTSTLRNTDGTGWIPVNLASASFGQALTAWPIDPSQNASNGLYYTYQNSSTSNTWELTSVMESAKYSSLMANDNGQSTGVYEVGTNLALAPSPVLGRGTPQVPGSSPTPVLTSISPTSTAAGSGSFTLTVNGSSFVSSSVVQWNGVSRATTFVTSTQLTATILAGDVASAGTAPVTVNTPAPGGGTSGSQNFTSVQYTASSSWTTDSTGGTSQNNGTSLAEDGGKVYVIEGGTNFQVYDPGAKTWTTKASTPVSFGNGASIVRYDSNTLFAFAGNSTTGFYKYLIGANTWTQEASTTAVVGVGGSLAYPGSGDLIYGVAGNFTNDFWAYSVSNNSWGQSAVAQGGGSSIAEDGGKLYVIDGNGSTFQSYDPSTDTWTTKTSTPVAFNSGAAIAKYDSDTLFALAGNGTTGFYKYSIGANTWTQMTSTTATVGVGASLAYPGTGDSIYALEGNFTANAVKYSVLGNSWTAVSSTPVTINYGGALVAFGTNNLYAMIGSNGTAFYNYNIASNTWTGKASLPAAVYAGGALTTDGTSIYATRGNNTTSFWKYDPVGNSWTALASSSAAIGTAGSFVTGGMAYSSTFNTIYAIPGQSTASTEGSIISYNPTTNGWPGPAYTPVTFNAGGALTAFNSDTLYAFPGTASTFYKYGISSGAWTTKTSPPASLGGGTALTTDGLFIYGLRGNSSVTFWKYDTGGDVWSQLASTTITVGNFSGNVGGGVTYSTSLHSAFAVAGTAGSIMKNLFQ